MKRERLRQILDLIPRTRVAVLGDYCLDAYWFIDESASQVSSETGKMTRPVAEQRYSLGGAGNVTSNLAALGVGRIYALGLVGEDLFGREMLRKLSALGVDTRGMFVQEQDWDTLVYAKPHLDGAEDRRIDFGDFNRTSDERAEALILYLESILDECQVAIINQQVPKGIHSDFMVEQLGRTIAKYQARTFILDSRHRSGDFDGVWLKVNAHEAARLCGIERRLGTAVPLAEAIESAGKLFERYRHPVFVTRGKRGCLVCDGPEVQEVPGIQILRPTDPVGAGDSMLAGIAAALAAGATPLEAAEIGNFAAAVTVQKRYQTGSAALEEVMAIGADPDYVYRPELAEDPRLARHIEGTTFEIVTELPPAMRTTHVILDHDGTISTLRQGWEDVMLPLMLRSILGSRERPFEHPLYHTVVDRVRDYIDKSTGVQTLVQMKALVEMVREFGCVPEHQVKDEFGYKEEYKRALKDIVNARLERVRSDKSSVEDFTIKGALRLLKALDKARVRLYLVSGTDQQEVEEEARALGYADLFEGRIYGAVGDITKEAKSVVLERILTDIGTEAVRKGLVTFGDGPVEVRETHKRGGLAIGVASDEVRRFGLNPTKRARLVRAGADLIIPDFSRLDRLLPILGISL